MSLRQFMIRNNFSIKDVAWLYQCSTQYIGHILKTKKVTAKVLKRLSFATGERITEI